jgi:putative Holliday junction resolvase
MILMRYGRILGLDFGAKNVGLAASDEMGCTVMPLPSIPNRGRRDLLVKIKAVAREQAVESIVIGLPLNMDGTAGQAVDRVRRFAGILVRELALPLYEADERLSSVEAEELWRAMNARQQRRYRSADSLAAALILERFLREA